MRALVLSGGGSKSAWSCGVLQHLLGDLQLKYDIICGVSSGAINSAFLAQYSHGQEQQSIQDLTDWWLKIDTKSIYRRHHPFGKLHALWGKSSLYDSQPLIDLLTANLSLDKIRASNKQISVGAVSLNSGKYTVFNQDDPDFVKAVIASAAFPGMLTPIEIRGHLFSDGGIKQISPLAEAIKLKADVIDVIITSPETRIKHFIEKPNVFNILQRAIDLASDKIMANDLEKAVLYNRLAEAGVDSHRIVRMNVIRPKHNLIEDLLDFDSNKIREMLKKGYSDAQKIGHNLV